MTDFQIVIASAGLGLRNKSSTPKCLINLGEETILNRQIRIIRNTFPQTPINIVVGFCKEKIVTQIPNVNFIINENFLTTGSSKSISLGLERICGDVLIVHGDLVFNNIFPSFHGSGYQSSFILGDRKLMPDSSIGIFARKENVTELSFIESHKHAQVTFLKSNDREKFIKETKGKETNIDFEILNNLLNQGMNLDIIEDKKNSIIDVDNTKSLKIAMTIKD